MPRSVRTRTQKFTHHLLSLARRSIRNRDSSLCEADNFTPAEDSSLSSSFRDRNPVAKSINQLQQNSAKILSSSGPNPEIFKTPVTICLVLQYVWWSFYCTARSPPVVLEEPIMTSNMGLSQLKAEVDLICQIFENTGTGTFQEHGIVQIESETWAASRKK